MKICINGEWQILLGEPTLKECLDNMEKELTSIAVALNFKFIPRSQYAHTTLKENDSVEILSPQQGG